MRKTNRFKTVVFIKFIYGMGMFEKNVHDKAILIFRIYILWKK